MTRTLALVLTLLGCTQALAGDFNPESTVIVNGKDTHVTNLEYSRWSIDNCTKSDWNHVGNEVQMVCSMDTISEKGGRTAITFTYHFVEISEKQTKLIRITTSRGYTLTPVDLDSSPLVLKGVNK
jgi:hypothetical protein